MHFCSKQKKIFFWGCVVMCVRSRSQLQNFFLSILIFNVLGVLQMSEMICPRLILISLNQLLKRLTTYIS